MALTQTLESGLKVSNAPSDGKFLQYKDSTDKLTWASAVTTVDTDKISEGNTTAEIDDASGGAGSFKVKCDGETNECFMVTESRCRPLDR